MEHAYPRAPIPRDLLYRYSNNGTHQTQYVTQNLYDQPMLNRRGQSIKTPSRNDVIGTAPNRYVSGTPQDTRVARLASTVYQLRIDQTAAAQLNNSSPHASKAQAESAKLKKSQATESRNKDEKFSGASDDSI